VLEQAGAELGIGSTIDVRRIGNGTPAKRT
jgi:hypothetical protein